KLEYEEEEYELGDNRAWTGQAARRAYENAIQQQVAVIDRLKIRDISTARKLVEDLVDSQTRNSSSEHIGMSLSRLSQQAELVGAPEPAVEWADWATRVNWSELKTFCHLADDLIIAKR